MLSIWEMVEYKCKDYDLDIPCERWRLLAHLLEKKTAKSSAATTDSPPILMSPIGNDPKRTLATQTLDTWNLCRITDDKQLKEFFSKWWKDHVEKQPDLWRATPPLKVWFQFWEDQQMTWSQPQLVNDPQ